MLRHLVNSLIIVLLFVSIGLAEEQKIELRNFKGLNTSSGDFFTEPNEARQAVNVDWGRNIGAITKRLGYDSVSYLSKNDSNVAIFPAYFSDGTQRLFVVADSLGVGYGGIWVTALNSSDLTTATLIKNFYSVNRVPSFTMMNDNVFISNGLQRPIVFTNDSTRAFPLPTIGQPDIIPLTTSGNLDGEYRYAFKAIIYNNDSSVVDTMHPFQLTEPVIVKDKQILFNNFWWFADDSLLAIDSARVQIYRNKANQKDFSEGTILYRVGTIASGGEINLDSASLVGATFIDSVGDADLHIDSSLIFSPNEFYGRDSLRVLTNRYYSSAGFVRSDSVENTPNNNMFDGYLTADDTTGFSYIITIIDTVIGVESNASAPFVYQVTNDAAGASLLDTIVINLPPLIPTLDGNGYFYNIYRAPLTRIQTDTGYFIEYWEERTTRDCDFSESFIEREGCESDPNCEVFVNKSGGWFLCRGGSGDSTLTNLWESIIIKDSKEFGSYKKIATISTDSSSYIDTLKQSSLANNFANPFYQGQSSPTLLDNLFNFQGRLWGTYKSTLYWSDINNPLSVGVRNSVDVNPNDGDIITALYPARQSIRVFKNYSSHNVYAGDDDVNYLDWNKNEVTAYYGNIAPRSLAAGVGGVYYLSNIGVMRENEAGGLERTYSVELVSSKLNNFDKLSFSAKVSAVGFYFDRKYMLNIGDTTYVYDERVNGWSKWSLKFNDAILYSTEDNPLFTAPDTMYFIKGDTNLYTYGSSEIDVNSAIQTTWLSAPILISDMNKSITAMSIWVNGISAPPAIPKEANFLNISIFNQNDSLLLISSILAFDTGRFLNISIGETEGKYYQFKFQSQWTDNDVVAFIDGIDIYFINTVKTIRE